MQQDIIPAYQINLCAGYPQVVTADKWEQFGIDGTPCVKFSFQREVVAVFVVQNIQGFIKTTHLPPVVVDLGERRYTLT